MEKNAIVNSQTNIFQNAVSATPDVSSEYCKGLQAMKGNSSVLKSRTTGGCKEALT